MYINIYHRQQGTNKAECITSYDDFNYFVVDETSKFVVKPDFIAPDVHNKEYSYKRYYYMLESFDGTKEDNAAIDDNTSKGLIKTEPKTSKAQLDAVAKYQKSRAEIRLRVSPEIKQLADKQAKSKGLSLTAYISQLIQEDAEQQH